LAEQLKAQGHKISPSKVAELLDELGYSLRHPDLAGKRMT
jgi:hypothetical protein